MKNNEKVRLPKTKVYVVTCYICCFVLILVGTDFFKSFIFEAKLIFTLCLCVVIFLVNVAQIFVSEDGIEIKVFFVPIRIIAADKIARIEIIEWHNVVRIVFEIGKCPRFREDNSIESLDDFYLLNMFRTIEYTPPSAQKEDILELLNSTFPGKVNIVEKDY